MGCTTGEDPAAHDEAYRHYCYCPASSHEDCVEMMPGPEGTGPEMNYGWYCGDLVASSLDGATCETRSGEINSWAQKCCVDKTSICPGTVGEGEQERDVEEEGIETDGGREGGRQADTWRSGDGG